MKILLDLRMMYLLPLSPFQIPRKVNNEIPLILTEFELKKLSFIFRVRLS